jgi:hypothetical protein
VRLYAYVYVHIHSHTRINQDQDGYLWRELSANTHGYLARKLFCIAFHNVYSDRHAKKGSCFSRACVQDVFLRFYFPACFLAASSFIQVVYLCSYVCMCTYLHVYMLSLYSCCIYIYIYIYISYIHICVYFYIAFYIRAEACSETLALCIYMYVYTHICMYIHIYHQLIKLRHSLIATKRFVFTFMYHDSTNHRNLQNIEITLTHKLINSCAYMYTYIYTHIYTCICMHTYIHHDAHTHCSCTCPCRSVGISGILPQWTATTMAYPTCAKL